VKRRRRREGGRRKGNRGQKSNAYPERRYRRTQS